MRIIERHIVIYFCNFCNYCVIIALTNNPNGTPVVSVSDTSKTTTEITLKKTSELVSDTTGESASQTNTEETQNIAVSSTVSNTETSKSTETKTQPSSEKAEEYTYTPHKDNYIALYVNYGNFYKYLNGWVYFKDNDNEANNWSIYRMLPDGSKKTKISEKDDFRSFDEYGGWIYYTTQGRHLFRKHKFK